jgi:hypothetical protein
MRRLLAALVALSLAPEAVHAQTVPSVQWRDLSFQLPSAEWHQVTPDPNKDAEGRRIVFDRAEAFHSLRLVVSPREAPPSLAPSEVTDQFVASQKKITEAPADDGKYSDFKSSAHSIGGRDIPTLSARFTPSSGPPITDETIALIFPADYTQRQRWLVVQWIDTHSGTANPLPLDELDALVASLRLRPLQTVLVADDFSDPENRTLRGSNSTDHFTVGYQDGEFQILKMDPDWKSTYLAPVPGTFSDVSVSVDVYSASDEPGAVAYLYCRHTSANGSYRAALDPIRGLVRIDRVKADGSPDALTPWTDAETAVQGTGLNHLDLLCRGSLIALDVNGTRAASARNSDLFEGSPALGAGAFSDTDTLPDIRFTNLLVQQR